MYKGEIPFSQKGEPLYYPNEEYEWEYNGTRYQSWYEIERTFGQDEARKAKRITVGPIWRPNAVFEAHLVVESFSRGRSAANFNLKDPATGLTYTMFLTDFLDLVKEHTLVNGKTPLLEWQFAKRGQNYGVMLADE